MKPPSPWQFGWAAVEAIAVVFAFMAASVAVGLEIRASRQRDEDARKRDEDERRRLAAGVTVWLSGAEVEDPQRPDSVIYGTFTIANGSVLPVIDVTVLICDRRGETPIETTVVPLLHVLAPSETLTFDLPKDMPFGDTDDPLDAFMLKLQFTDGNGRRWERNGRGELRVLDSDPYP